jgi:hypothetical protein
MHLNPHLAAGAYDAWLTGGWGDEYLESVDRREMAFSESLLNLLIMILEPEILSSGTQKGNINYESYRSNYESYNILIPQAVLKK